MSPFLFLLILFHSGASASESDAVLTPILLPEIEATASPWDISVQGSALQTQVPLGSGIQSRSGSAASEVADALALPLKDTGIPGAVSGVRGPGVYADETAVQALGVPLNSALGGGLDWSIFPQFLWSDAQVSQGLNPGSGDARGLGTSIALSPWSEWAMRAGTSGVKSSVGFEGEPAPVFAQGRAWASSLGAAQFSGSFASERGAAGVAGFSLGRVRGPSVGLSTRIIRPQSDRAIELNAHLLATAVDTDGLVFSYAPKPVSNNVRLIPVLEARARLSDSAQWLGSLYYDGSAYRNWTNWTASADPSFQIVAQQLGTQNWLLWDKNRIGLQARGTFVNSNGISVPLEGELRAVLSRKVQWGWNHEWSVEPVVQGTWVSGFTLLPEGSVRLGRRWGETLQGTVGGEAFAAVAYQRRFPTIDPFFLGNPGLQPESMVSAQLGDRASARLGEWRFGADTWLAAGYREGVMLFTGSTTENRGAAWQGSATALVSARAKAGFFVSPSVTFQQTRVIDTGLPMPLSPEWVGVARIGWERPELRSPWGVFLSGRVSGDFVASAAGGPLGGYVTWDAGAWWQPGFARQWGLKAQAGVQNITDRSFEVGPQSPAAGRSVTASLSAAL